MPRVLALRSLILRHATSCSRGERSAQPLMRESVPSSFTITGLRERDEKRDIMS